jgi:predicted RNA binding protein YcfA (HicA-like mRNA interferase family)
MTERLPVVRAAEIIAALQKAGWTVHRQRGSHLALRKTGQQLVIVPTHTGDMPKGTLRGIISDAGLSVEQFVSLLRQ